MQMVISADSPIHPPATNRGVETHSSQQIDWISFTLPTSADRIWPDDLPTKFTKGKPFNAYDTAKSFADGRIELQHTTRPEMGIHCILSGVTCSNLRSHLSEILQVVWSNGGKVTRLDLALNDLCGRIDPQDATNYIAKGEIKTRAKQFPIFSDPHLGGYTQYVGKMASEVHFCLYDKSAEQGQSGFTIRAEIRFKGKKADKAARVYQVRGDCRELILGFVDFPTWQQWKDVFDVFPVAIPSEKKDTNRVTWLLTQVAASMAKQITEEGDESDILERFKRAIDEQLSSLRHGSD